MRVTTMLSLLVICAVFSMNPPQAWCTSTPIVHFQFDEGAENVAVNSGTLGSLANGSISGAVYSSDTPLVSGYSLAFDGTEDFVRVEDTFDYTDQLTIAAWIKPNAVNGQRIIWDDYGSPGVLLAVAVGQLQFGISTTTDPGLGIAIYDGTIDVGEWQHVAGVYDGSEIRVYINGKHTGAIKTTSGEITDNPGSPTYAAIGSSNVEPYLLNFDGLIDDFRIYNEALTPEEIAYLAVHPVTIDIKPGAYPNSINLGSKGSVPVAILTTDDFDASTVDPATVVFAAAAPIKQRMTDVDSDGDIDMVLYFDTQALNLNANITEATLTGMTYDEIDITGTDSVTIVTKGKK